MALFRNLQCRALMIAGSRTSIALEPQFWKIADKLSKAHGISWQEWTERNLIKHNIKNNRASALRVAILEEILS